ncbi:alanine racemase [Alphaproteobacteria bacterium]|nr:alanine racemase [Alphaproteobacteria bacterium]MDC0131504.1 alanine racemase [Alphaproteobacteria bacterium]
MSRTTALDGGQVTIDLAALRDNYQTMKTRSRSAEAACVVKADAYGLGMAQVAAALYAAGCRSFFVAQAGEALDLRALLPDVIIYVLNGLPTGAAADFASANLRPCLISLEQILAWQDFCREQKEALPAALFIDTGFNRLGLNETDIADLADAPERFDNWTLSLIASHLACSDTPENPMNKAQLERFQNALAQLPKAPASLANSGGILMGEDYLFDMTRIGISLYGGGPSGASSALTPVVELHAPLLQTRALSLGESVGYGATFTAPHEMQIGIVGLGYGDGFMRHFGNLPQNRPCLKINGQDAPILGRVSMDSLAVDLTDFAVLPVADTRVEVFGQQQSIDNLAANGNTISYELLTSLGNRYKRIWTN